MIYMFAAVAVATAAMGCPAEAASMTVNAEAVAMKAPKGEIKTVVFVTNMHCQKCVNKVNDNIAFEKGVKDMKTITIKYDASKTSVEKLATAINKLGYTAEVKK